MEFGPLTIPSFQQQKMMEVERAKTAMQGEDMQTLCQQMVSRMAQMDEQLRVGSSYCCANCHYDY